jgi:hypothetical protein
MTGLPLDIVIIGCTLVIVLALVWHTDKVIGHLNVRIGNLGLELGREFDETRRELRRIEAILNRAYPAPTFD